MKAIFSLLFGFLPPVFQVLIMIAIVVIVIILVLKIVKLVLDAIPFI